MTPDLLYERATLAIKNRRMEDARRLLFDAVKMNPRHEQAWLALASVVTDTNQAIDCLKRVLAINPGNQTARDWLQLAQQEKARQEAVAEMNSEPVSVDSEAATVVIDEPGDQDRAVPRLGRYLLDYKFITADQLKAALLAQRRSADVGELRRLGDILLDQGALTKERLDFALREQHRGFYSLFND